MDCQMTLGESPVRTQLEVTLSANDVARRRVIEVSIQDLLRQSQRPIESLAHDVRILLQLRMWQRDSRVEVADVNLKPRN